jgi:hypothetical protein
VKVFKIEHPAPIFLRNRRDKTIFAAARFSEPHHTCDQEPLHGACGTKCVAPNGAAIQGAGATVDARVIVRNVVEPPPARALASLVRVASSHPSRPSRKTASSVAQVRRAKMGIGHLQRFGTTMDLSQDWNSRRGRCRGRLRGLMAWALNSDAATVDRVVAVLEKKGVRFTEAGVELTRRPR